MNGSEGIKISFEQREAMLRELMSRSLLGNEAAYRELMRELVSILRDFFSNGVRKSGVTDLNVVDDLIQETLLGIHRKRHTYDKEQLFTPWLYAIARYKLIDFQRRNYRFRAVGGLEPLTAEKYAEDWNEADPLLSASLLKAMADLPDKQRVAVELVKLQELSIDEATQRMGMSASAVKVSLHRAVKALRKNLEDG